MHSSSFFGNPVRWHRSQLFKHYGDDSHKLFVANVLASVLLGLVVIISVFLTLNLAIDESLFSGHAKKVFIPIEIAIVCTLGFAYVALVFGRHAISRSIFTFMSIVATFVSITLTGGFPNSVASPCIILLPVVVYCLHGSSAGLRASVLIPATAFMQWLLVHQTGVILPDFTSTALPSVNSAMVVFVTYSTVVFVMYCYERNANTLRNKLDGERRKLADLANLDGLTGLFNARYFREILNAAVEIQADGRCKQFKLVYLDLDGFKPINDTYGHEAGDAVLSTVAKRLQSKFRGSDIVARMGGDEFAILIQEKQDLEGVPEIKARLREIVTDPIKVEGKRVMVGTSIGIVECSGYAASTTDLIKRADAAMYDDKKQKAARLESVSKSGSETNGLNLTAKAA